jgi:hypothetical protein
VPGEIIFTIDGYCSRVLPARMSRDMLRRALLASAVLLAFALSSPAQAGIPIPCTATHFLKAGDLMSVMDTSGQKMPLYYSVSGCSGGRWDGYRGADGKYHQLNPNILSSLPAAPGFWASAWQNKAKFWAEWLWILVGAFVVIGTLLSKLAGAGASGGLSPEGNPRSVRGP